MDADTTITKRLIISGLTPAITEADIQRRLSTFGTVKATDGFGLKDGVDQPRKFAYVTIETTTGKLSRCMNLLSGSTWKGAKLRFGEAKPDFKERIAKEIEQNGQLLSDLPKKKRKFGATLAEDMSLVTPENAKQRGWKVTEMGRIMKPVKIRPARPLPDVEETRTKNVKGKGEPTEKKKKRVKEPDARARRRTIDMTKWGSTHLKGMFLDLAVVGGGDPSVNKAYDVDEAEDEASESDSSSEEEVEELLDNPSHSPPAPVPASAAVPEPSSKVAESIKTPKPATHSIPTKIISTASHIIPSVASTSQLPDNNIDIELEKTKSLNLLSSLFKDDDDDDWIAQESVGSDIDEEALTKGDKMLVDDDADTFEIVPKNVAPISQLKRHVPQDEEDEEEEDAMVVEKSQPQTVMKLEEPAKKSKPGLKDLFAPTAKETGFSLLGHLDLELDLDEELAFAVQPSAQETEEYTASSVPVTVTQTVAKSHTAQVPMVLNPKQALFFPLPSDGNITKARQKDFFDLVKDNRWNWADPSVAFYRTGTEEDIRKRWEDSKRDLTTDWMKRWKEAGKLNRRRRGGVDVDNV